MKPQNCKSGVTIREWRVREEQTTDDGTNGKHIQGERHTDNLILSTLILPNRSALVVIQTRVRRTRERERERQTHV